MKNRTTLMLCCILSVTSAFSQIAEGYYRICNYATERYIYIVDNKCNTPIPSDLSDAAIGRILDQGVDFGSIVLYTNHEKTISNASSILYISRKEGSTGDEGYNIAGQDISTYKLLKQYFNIKKNLQNGQYSPYMDIKSYGTQYLFDREATFELEKGIIDIKQTVNIPQGCKYKAIDFRSWIFEPLDAETDNYFGIAPTIQSEGKLYAPFFTGFPFKTKSNGMKVYIVTMIENGVAVMKELADGIVPAATPVIIECSSSKPSDNRLEFVKDKSAAPSNNILKGVYYSYVKYNHNNYVAYSKDNMRVLGLTKDGKLGLVTSADMVNLPANSSYLQLSGSNINSEYMLMTETEYNEYLEEIIRADANKTLQEIKPFVVYSILGTVVNSCCYSTDELENGIYIIDGKKVIVTR